MGVKKKRGFKMAIVSTKGVYGLTAILILAKEKNKDLLQIKEIAAKGEIPQNYLEQILVTLKKSGLVESIRGANGGYKLLQHFWEDTQKKIEKIFMLSISDLEEFLDKKSD